MIAVAMLAGKVPVMINWTLGDANIEHVSAVSGMKTILTSASFLDRLDSIDFDRISEHVVTLESLRKHRFTLWSKILAALRARGKAERVCRIFGSGKTLLDDPAVILFTSDLESAPKGVPLSHKNILCNIAGCLDAVRLESNDSL